MTQGTSGAGEGGVKLYGITKEGDSGGPVINMEVPSKATIVAVSSSTFEDSAGVMAAYHKVTEAMKASIVKFMNGEDGKRAVFKARGDKTLFGDPARMVDEDYYEGYFDADYDADDNMWLYEMAEDNMERARQQLQVAQHLMRLQRDSKY